MQVLFAFRVIFDSIITVYITAVLKIIIITRLTYFPRIPKRGVSEKKLLDEVCLKSVAFILYIKHYNPVLIYSGGNPV